MLSSIVTASHLVSIESDSGRFLPLAKSDHLLAILALHYNSLLMGNIPKKSISSSSSGLGYLTLVLG